MTKSMVNKLRNNVYKNYIYSFMSNFHLTSGVWMLYLAYRGLSLLEIGIMESIFHMTSFTMEVPTGMIADIYGRKTSRVLGRILAVIGTMIMILAGNVYLFALSLIIQAISYNLESGAGDALIYDSLKAIGEEKDYMKITGRREIAYQLASSGSLIIGGYLATIDYKLVYWASLVIGTMTILQSLSFTEPEYGRIEREENGFKTLYKQLVKSVKVLINDKKIGLLIVVLEVFSLFYTTEFFYIQNHMKMLGSSELKIGVTLAVGSLGGAFMATMIHKFDEKYSPDQIIRVFPILGIIGFWLMTNSSITPFAFVFLSMVEGAMFVSIGDYVNRLIPSEQRATIISFQSMLFSILMICLFPVVGWLGDIYGLGYAFFGIAILATIVLSILFYIIISNGKHFKEI